MNVRTRELRGGDEQTISITSKGFDVLSYLVKHRDRAVEENNLHQAVSALLQVLGCNMEIRGDLVATASI